MRNIHIALMIITLMVMGRIIIVLVVVMVVPVMDGLSGQKNMQHRPNNTRLAQATTIGLIIPFKPYIISQYNISSAMIYDKRITVSVLVVLTSKHPIWRLVLKALSWLTRCLVESLVCNRIHQQSQPITTLAPSSNHFHQSPYNY